MTSQDPSTSSGEGMITYWLAHGGYQGVIRARERFDELVERGHDAHAIETLKARGSYDPAKHTDTGKREPFSAAEHLEVLALGDLLARHYRHPTYVDKAVQAGASWSQIAEAVGSDETQVRQQYREWADWEHHLYEQYEGKLGIDDRTYAAAINRACEPSTGSAAEREAGQ